MTTTEIIRALVPHANTLVRELLPDGSEAGTHWIESTVDVDTETGLWSDSISGESGDLLSLISLSNLLTTEAAVEWATKRFSLNGQAEQFSVERQISRVAKGLPINNGKFDPLEFPFKQKEETVWRHGRRAFTYRDAIGKIIGWTVEFSDTELIPFKLKGTPPEPKQGGWKKPLPKPIYGLELLLQRPDAPVIITSTESQADSARLLFPDYIVLSWMGGAKNVSYCDWSNIADRISGDTEATLPDGTLLNPGARIYLWPEKSKPGRESATFLKARFPRALVVNVAPLPDRWNFTLPAPKDVDLLQLLQSAGTVAPAVEREPATFRCLGHDESGFFYHSYRTGYLVHLTAPAHTELELQVIAPDQYWIDLGFFKDRGNGIDWKAVAKHLMETNFLTGHFDTAYVRGLGCWIEPPTPDNPEERIIFHAGDRLFVNGVPMPLHEHKSRYIYPRRRSVDITLDKIATKEDGKRLAKVYEMLPLAPGSFAWAISAWDFIAPISGALYWRPHLWTIGEAGSGKSWRFANISALLLGDCCLKILSATTAAGMRQALGCDALPVIGDEIETNNTKAQARTAQMLDLTRQSSSETGGSIYHGTTDGSGKVYRVRSCFSFSSIVCGALESADESRFYKVEFKKRDDPEAFNELCRRCADTVANPEFCMSMRARAVSLVREIRAAAKIFTHAVGIVAKDFRKGEQFGTLAAGHWMMTSDSIPTEAEAAEWAASIDWKQIGHDSDDTDSARAIDVLYQYRTFLQDNESRRHDATVGELIDIWFSDALPRDQRADFAYDALMRLGIHPIHKSVDIAVRWPELRKVFAGTQFADNWADNIRQVPGAETKVFRAAGNRLVKAVRVPK